MEPIMQWSKWFAAARAVPALQRLPGAIRTVSIGINALLTGSRAIPLGDNGVLLRELAARSGGPRRPDTEP
jgi:hypothetical protein